MDEREVRAVAIADRVFSWVKQRDLPDPDWCQDPLTPYEATQQAAFDLLKRHPLTNDECFRYLICTEHVDPTLEEDVALTRMDEVFKEARARCEASGIPWK